MNGDSTRSLSSQPLRWTAALGTPRLWFLQAVFLAALSVSSLTERIPLPFTPVPLTLQVFMVFLSALFLGGRRSLPVVGGYLLLGGAGLPVFSGGGAGVGYLSGATGGYLLGFLASAWVVGVLIKRDLPGLAAETGRSVRLIRDSAVLSLGLVIIYSFGGLWLRAITGLEWRNVLALGVFPFVGLDVVKVVTAYSIYRLLGGKVDRFLS